MKNSKLVLIGLLAAVLGFGVQGCFSPQPAPECTVVTGQALFDVTNYMTQLEKVSQTGGASCETLDHMEVGMTRLPLTSGQKGFGIVVRAARLVDAVNGHVYSADVDAENNCTNEEHCDVCVNEGADGGYELADGTGLREDMGTYYFVGGEADGGDLEVDVANHCESKAEDLPREDPADPKGANINSLGTVPQYPSAGICKVQDFTGGVQNFSAVEDLEGNMVAAAKAQAAWSNFEVVSTAKAPATYFTAELAYTEGSCVTNYKAMGWWPIVYCEEQKKDADGTLVLDGDHNPIPVLDANGNQIPDESRCNPNADLDAGRIFGSGMSPYFKPVCKVIGKDAAGKATTLVCVPSATKEELLK